MIGEFAGIIASLLNAEFPDHLRLCAARRTDGIGDGNEPAEIRLAYFSDIVLDDKGVAYGLDI
jgi:hypothetical protein